MRQAFQALCEATLFKSVADAKQETFEYLRASKLLFDKMNLRKTR